VGVTPAPWEEFAIWAAGGLVVLAVFGAAIPKPIMLLSAPFVKMIEGI